MTILERRSVRVNLACLEIILQALYGLLCSFFRLVKSLDQTSYVLNCCVTWVTDLQMIVGTISDLNFDILSTRT